MMFSSIFFVLSLLFTVSPLLAQFPGTPLTPSSQCSYPGFFLLTGYRCQTEYMQGNTYTIEWLGGDPSWNVSIVLDQENGSTYSVSTTPLPNSVQNYEWTIPDTILCNQAYNLYVTEDSSSPKAWVYGPIFIIYCQPENNKRRARPIDMATVLKA